MPGPLTRVTMLYCGQGMMTLIEVFDNGNEKAAPDHLALVDCGGDGGTPALDSLKYIADRVDLLPANQKKLELVVISHQDADHLSYLGILGDHLKKLGATVDKIVAGGLDWSDASELAMQLFAPKVGLTAPDVKAASPTATDYPANGKKASLKTQATLGTSVHVRLLANAVTTGGGDKRNKSSAVIVVDDGDNQLVLPGDATVGTMAYINNRTNIAGLLPKVAALQVPHHGALKTSVTGYKTRTPRDPSKNDPGNSNDFNYTVLEKFAATMASQRAAASAGPYNEFGHPMREVMRRFRKDALQEPDHRYVTFDFNKQRWRTVHGVKAVFTTVQRVQDSADRYTGKKFGRKPAGRFVYGDIIFRLAPPGTLRPEEIAEFRPRGTLGADPVGEPVIEAPAP